MKPVRIPIGFLFLLALQIATLATVYHTRVSSRPPEPVESPEVLYRDCMRSAAPTDQPVEIIQPKCIEGSGFRPDTIWPAPQFEPAADGHSLDLLAPESDPLPNTYSTE